jgi:hypothetical protein
LAGRRIATATAVAAAAVLGTADVTPAAAASSDLAINLPSTATLRGDGQRKKVFAHYMPSMPMSYDNKTSKTDYWTRHYLRPGGEGGIHSAYGGFTRDRPKGRAVRKGSDWRLSDMKTEVRQAIAAGIDGFSVDLLSLETSNRNLVNTKLLMTGARAVDPGFSVMLVPDMNSSVGSLTPAQLASGLAKLAASPAAFRLRDGRLVVAPFMAERHSAAWWSQFLTAMRQTHGIRVAFVPTFLDERPHLAAFAPISYGMSNWGSRNPRWNNSTVTTAGYPLYRARAVRSRGLLWMQPVSYQDERPRWGVFDEALNTANLRASWQLAMRSGAEWVQLATWNDYAEGSHLAPSARRGWAPLDINAYYLTWFKLGRRPAVARDAVYLTHRRQAWSTRPSYPQKILMRLRGGSPARNKVEALTMVTARSTVFVKVGTVTRKCTVPAGVSVCTVPLRPGPVSVRVSRGGKSRAAVSSPFVVRRKPIVQDLQYVSVGSLRQGTR